MAATFGCVWLLRKTQPTDWTKYPEAGFLAVAVAFVSSDYFTSPVTTKEYWKDV